MSQKAQDDGSIIVTLSKRGDPRVSRFCVKNLYQEDEEVLWEED